jgi:hypothetical protein
MTMYHTRGPTNAFTTSTTRLAGQHGSYLSKEVTLTTLLPPFAKVTNPTNPTKTTK